MRKKIKTYAKTISKINVDLKKNSYTILVGKNYLKEIPSLISKYVNNKIIIITDDNVEKHHLKTLLKTLDIYKDKIYYISIAHGEKSKSLKTYSHLIEKILEQKIERNDLIISFGGGVVGDISGFIASTILRGIKFIQIPTTLLSQVDSSVGGKTGINSSFGKNLIGSFYQPSMVIIDTYFLQTLPKRQLLSGYAEVFKYSLIKDRKFFDWLLVNGQKVIDLDKEILTKAIIKSCEIKAEIVKKDEKENNIRAILNYGHTFGHSLENLANYSDKILHGEAIAIGFVMAAELSLKLGLFNNDDLFKIIEHLNQIGLPTNLKKLGLNFSENEIYSKMTNDKKSENGKVKYILLENIGKSIIKSDIEKNIIIKTISNNLE